MPVLVDSNVLLDILTEDTRWYGWSSETLADLADSEMLYINPLIYAEVSVRFEHARELEEALPEPVLKRAGLPYEAAFLAGKCFLQYRTRGGAKRAPMPDFYIGAHAVVMQWALLTRDTARYATYFPSLALIAPPSS